MSHEFTNLQDFTNNLFKTIIESELESEYTGRTEIIEAVKKCMKHINCLGCMDTGNFLLDSESYFGGTYEEFTCPACTKSHTKNRLDSHHQIYHALVNGRQVPYNGNNKTVGYSRVMQLYDIYKKNYEKIDILEEEKEKYKKEAQLLAEKNKPLWDFIDSKELQKEITNVDVNVDISKLIDDVNNMLLISAGNLVSLPVLLKGLNLSLQYYWSNESSKNNSFYKTKDENGETVYIKFEYNKTVTEKNGGIGLFRMNGKSKKEYLSVIYFIAKPKNDAAEAICSDLMNRTIQNIVDKIKR
jgi:hypothetical protein